MVVLRKNKANVKAILVLKNGFVKSVKCSFKVGLYKAMLVICVSLGGASPIFFQAISVLPVKNIHRGDSSMYL